MQLLYSEISEKDHHLLMQANLNFFPEVYQQQLLKYRKWQDAQLSLLGKLLLKTGLSRFHTKFDFKQIQYSEYNKPYIKNSSILFNISHSEELVVCVLSEDLKSIGIDIEKKRPIDLGDYKGQMTENEKCRIFNSAQPQEAFFRYWTEKEAVIKAHGFGLSIPLQSFEINKNCTCIDKKTFYVSEVWLKQGYFCHVASDQNVPSDKIKISNIHVNRFLHHEA